MLDKLYLSDWLGWDTASRSKVAISQLREGSIISKTKCPKVQLLKNRTYRFEANVVKFLGYLPVVHIIVGIGVILVPQHSDPNYLRPNHNKLWKLRGIAIMSLGPLLFIADLAKFIFDCIIVSKYNRAHKTLIGQFDPPHGHTPEYYPGHPIRCCREST